MIGTRRLMGSLLVIVAMVAAIGWHVRHAPETYPYADTATTSIYTLRAAHGELATGAYSRFGWHHPGPLLYQLLAPGYVLSGHREVSLKWTMLVLNVAVLAAWLTVLRRRAPLLSVGAMIAIAPLILWEQRLLFWPWNPVAPLLGLALAIALAAHIAAGGTRSLPWLCATVSFLVQAHVGLAPMGVALTAWALVAVIRQWMGATSANVRATVRRSVIIAVVVAAVLWAVPIGDSLAHAPGNLGAIAAWSANHHQGIEWRRAAEIVATELIAPFDRSRELITGTVPASAPVWVLALALGQWVFLSVLALRSRRSGDGFVAGLSGICAIGIGVALLSVHSIEGDLYDHQILWIGVIGIMNAALALHALSKWLSRWLRSDVASRVSRSAVVAFIAWSAVLGILRLDGKQRADAYDRTLLELTDALVQYCDEQRVARPVLTYDEKVWAPAAGLVLQFYKRDRPIAVTDAATFMFGRTFARTGAESAELYLMAVEDSEMPAGVTRFTWIATAGAFRVVQVFRD
jgi:hypothetical protein